MAFKTLSGASKIMVLSLGSIVTLGMTVLVTEYVIPAVQLLQLAQQVAFETPEPTVEDLASAVLVDTTQIPQSAGKERAEMASQTEVPLASVSVETFVASLVPTMPIEANDATQEERSVQVTSPRASVQPSVEVVVQTVRGFPALLAGMEPVRIMSTTEEAIQPTTGPMTKVGIPQEMAQETITKNSNVVTDPATETVLSEAMGSVTQTQPTTEDIAVFSSEEPGETARTSDLPTVDTITREEPTTEASIISTTEVAMNEESTILVPTTGEPTIESARTEETSTQGASNVGVLPSADLPQEEQLPTTPVDTMPETTELEPAEKRDIQIRIELNNGLVKLWF